MAVKYNVVNNTSGDETQYKTDIDAAAAVLRAGPGGQLYVQAATPLAMRVSVLAGRIQNGTALVEVATQDTGVIAAPTTNPRIDRVSVDKATGTIVVTTGAEGASPSPPAIPAGDVVLADVYLVPAQAQIANADITDRRPFWQG